jgi:hypothetical protein
MKPNPASAALVGFCLVVALITSLLSVPAYGLPRSAARDDPAPSGLVATTGQATAVVGLAATIAGSVTPCGASVVAGVIYGTDPALLTGNKSVTVPGTITGSTKILIKARLRHLKLATSYHYRTWAADISGTALGDIKTFKTSDIMMTGPTISNNHSDPSPMESLSFNFQKVPLDTRSLSGTLTVTGTRIGNNQQRFTQSRAVQSRATVMCRVKVRHGQARCKLALAHSRWRLNIRFVGRGDLGSRTFPSRIIRGTG